MPIPRRKSIKVVPVDNDAAINGDLPVKNETPRVAKLPVMEVTKSLLKSPKGQLPPLKGRRSGNIGKDTKVMGRGLDMAVLGKATELSREREDEDEDDGTSEASGDAERDSDGDGTANVVECKGNREKRDQKDMEISEPTEKGDGPRNKDKTSEDLSYYVPLLTSYRLSLSLTCLLITMCLSLLRSNMSVAVICMVRRPLTPHVVPSDNLTNPTLSVNSTNPHNSTSFHAYDLLRNSDDNSSYAPRGRQSPPTFDKRPLEFQGEFDWSRSTQGYVLSSYYYGYIVTQIPGGWLGARFGGKKVILSGLSIGILSSLATPLAARYSVYFCMACRFFCGLSMGVFLPAVHSLLGRWAPPQERSLLIVLAQSGIDLGCVMAMMLSGFMCNLNVDGGWPFIFYIYGAFATLVLLLFVYVAHSSPDEHPRIDQAEKIFINRSIGTSTSERVATPWRHILTSPAVLAIVVGHTTVNWGFYMFMSCIPMYISDVFGTKSEEMGLLSGLPFIATFIACVLGGRAADFLRSSADLTTATVRKLMQTIGQTVPAVAVVLCGFAGSPSQAVAALTTAVGFVGLTRSGYSCNHVDIAPRHAGLLIGISNTIATIPGMVGPIVAGALTSNGSVEEWRIVFYIVAGVNVAGAAVYCLLAKGEELDWPGNRSCPIEVKVTQEVKV